jgi:hypothetical protein
MRSTPEDKYDLKDLARINAEPWMVDLLKLNPSYTGWGPHEDYMWTKDGGWNAPILHESWTAFKGMTLDDLNECVNFYFEVARENKACEVCSQSGYNPATLQISEDFYDFEGTGRRWRDKITEDEVDALIEAGRIGRRWDKTSNAWVPMDVRPTAAEINAENSPGAKGFGHDGINRYILIEARAKRLGVYGLCGTCHGAGYVYTEPAAHVNLVLWWLHPRKGCSRGIEVKNIQQSELPEVYAMLREAAERNAQRFAKIPRS